MIDEIYIQIDKRQYSDTVVAQEQLLKGGHFQSIFLDGYYILFFIIACLLACLPACLHQCALD